MHAFPTRLSADLVDGVLSSGADAGAALPSVTGAVSVGAASGSAASVLAASGSLPFTGSAGLSLCLTGGWPRSGRYSAPDCPQADSNTSRSEEHTSELQSLKRHSYAVFCLKK